MTIYPSCSLRRVSWSSRSGRIVVVRFGATVCTLSNAVFSSSAGSSKYIDMRSSVVFGHFDTMRKRVLEVFYMGDDQNLFKIRLDRLDHLDQLLPSLAVLRTKAFVQNQRLQFRA